MDKFEFSVESIGEPEKAVIWPMYNFSGNEKSHLLEELNKAGVSDMILVPVIVNDWDSELSPWEAPMAEGEELFKGGGPETLKFIEQELIPEIKGKLPVEHEIFIAGYSLAGLFALWSMYNTDAFKGAVCCSPSVWFEGWDEFAALHSIKGTDKYIYLSLGGKEEKTSNTMMSRVGVRIREQEKLLKADSHVKNVFLEWNSGGHFADSGKRLSKGINKILEMS